MLRPGSFTLKFKALYNKEKIIEKSTIVDLFTQKKTILDLFTQNKPNKADYLEMLCFAIEKYPNKITLEALTYLIEITAKKGYLSSPNHIRGDQTPLHVATEVNSVECTRLLIESKANINAKDSKQSAPAPLHVAIEAKSSEMINQLFAQGVSLSCKDQEGNTPLHIVAKMNWLDGAVQLIREGIKIGSFSKNLSVLSKMNNAGLTPSALVEDKSGILYCLLNLKSFYHVNAKTIDALKLINDKYRTDEGVLTYLLNDVWAGDGDPYQDIEGLINNKKIDLSKSGLFLWSALVEKIKHFEKLLECPSYRLGETDAHLKRRIAEVLRAMHCLMGHGINATTPLIEESAKLKTSDALFILLHSKKLTVSELRNLKKTCNYGFMKVFESVLGAIKYYQENKIIPSEENLDFYYKKVVDKSLEKTDQNKNTALHLAAAGGKNWLPAVQYLLKNSANVTAKNNDLNTPLHRAVQAPEANIEVVKSLIESKADLGTKNRLGKTPKDDARDIGLDQSIIDILDPEKNISSDKIAIQDQRGDQKSVESIATQSVVELPKSDLKPIATPTEQQRAEEKQSTPPIFKLFLMQTIDLFSKQLIYQAELKQLIDDLPFNEDSFKLAHALIEAFNEPNIRKLIAIESQLKLSSGLESSVVRLAELLIKELESQVKQYSKPKTQFQSNINISSGSGSSRLFQPVSLNETKEAVAKMLKK